MLPIIGTALAVAGGIGKMYGDYRAGKQAKDGREEFNASMGNVIGNMESNVQGQRDDISRYLEPDLYRNYMETAEAESVMSGARENLQNLSQQIRGGVARTGGTVESAIAGQSAGARNYADVVSRLAGHGTAYKQNAQRMHQGALQGWRGAQQGVEASKANHAGNLLSQSQQMAQGHAQSGQGFLEAMTGLAATDPQLPEWLQGKPKPPTQEQKYNAARARADELIQRDLGAMFN
jgi:hypothetical protein